MLDRKTKIAKCTNCWGSPTIIEWKGNTAYCQHCGIKFGHVTQNGVDFKNIVIVNTWRERAENTNC